MSEREPPERVYGHRCSHGEVLAWWELRTLRGAESDIKYIRADLADARMAEAMDALAELHGKLPEVVDE